MAEDEELFHKEYDSLEDAHKDYNDLLDMHYSWHHDISTTDKDRVKEEEERDRLKKAGQWSRDQEDTFKNEGEFDSDNRRIMAFPPQSPQVIYTRTPVGHHYAGVAFAINKAANYPAWDYLEEHGRHLARQSQEKLAGGSEHLKNIKRFSETFNRKLDPGVRQVNLKNIITEALRRKLWQ